MRNTILGLTNLGPVASGYRTLPLMLFFLLMIGIPLTASSQEDALLALEQTRFKAQIDQDTALLSTLLHPDLYFLHSNGLAEDKAGFIRSVNSAKIVYQAMTPSQQVVRQYKKTAILTGLLLVSGLYEGTPFEVKLYYSSVYLKKRRKWYLLNWQSTGKK